MTQSQIPGYTYGTGTVLRSPVSLQDFQEMKAAAMFTDEDIRYLKMSYDVLSDQVEAILDVWYNFFAAQPQLRHAFDQKGTGKPEPKYLAAVRKRFGRWILDTARAEYDQEWLDYQYEIGRRHCKEAKNETDHVDAVEYVSFRYLIPTVYPIVSTLKPFLARKGHSPADVEKMYEAWMKSVLLQVALWSYPYVKDGEY
ncbi:protoglobin [Thermosporothrix hazakensis]|jgi:hypothetical protein|uniref:Protoglobin n=2 Tax=Thermosporothrix TaxID=768650 RepID=A0A326UST6_THEHA|nr:protoglobin domain-containing protein [Thermosporothrix hazakensis]PZW34467.1 protoglobin [Thermosporothrix hazakensis]BBH85590.1 hypothetical protein KTC_03410 [Thermosporothrix sp. COM3]GCE45983.1 hypothetical protein KTH_08520 [Thermosporothrix hazakensis]